MAERIAIKDLQKLEQSSGIVDLYEIELNNNAKAYITKAPDGSLQNIELYDYDTHTQKNTYIPIPLEIEGIDVTTKGVSARPVLTIANILTDFENAISPLTFQDLIGKKIYRRRTLQKYLVGEASETASGVAPVEFPRQMWVVDRVEQEDSLSIAFELTSPFNTEGLVLPYRVVGHNACPWQYQGASPEKTESNKRGGCSWHTESKYIINGVAYQVYVNSDDEYIIPSTVTFTTWAGSGVADGYYKTTTTLGTSSQVRRYSADGTIDTSADGSTVLNYWQATRTTSVTPQDNHSDWLRVRVYESYSTSTTYYAYTDDKLNMFARATSGSELVWQTKITQSNNALQFGNYWKRGDLCGKRLSSCQTRFGFAPITPSASTSTGKATKVTTRTLPFGGFPGARKFK